MRGFAALALLCAASSTALAGCGLRPMYAADGSGVARELAAIEVPPIADEAGWLVHDALLERLGRTGVDVPARYRLQVVLDQQLEGLGLLSDDSVGRERLTLRARYQLVDLSSGEVLLDATAGTDAGIDVVSSEYATIAAEERALENLSQQLADLIVTRLALLLRGEP